MVTFPPGSSKRLWQVPSAPERATLIAKVSHSAGRGAVIPHNAGEAALAGLEAGLTRPQVQKAGNGGRIQMPIIYQPVSHQQQPKGKNLSPFNTSLPEVLF